MTLTKMQKCCSAFVQKLLLAPGHVVSGCDHLNPSIREHDGRMMETLGACSRCIAAALKAAARDAAKKERERCARVAEKTKVDPFDFSKDVRPAVKTFRHIVAAAIRALPPEEGKVLPPPRKRSKGKGEK